MSSPLFDRAGLLELLTALAERLQVRGVRANIYVVGGAAISLVFDARRATRDVDSVVLSGHGPLMDEVRALGRERGLPGTWLNEQATMYVSKLSDDNKAVVFDHPALIVAAASAEHLLAMKMQAARLTDADDLRLLLRVLGISEVSGALEVHETVFPSVAISDRAQLLLEDILKP
jgi:predicted nucleotidyltransferase